MAKEKEVKELHYGGDSGFPPRRRPRRPIREPRRRPLGPDDRPIQRDPRGRRRPRQRLDQATRMRMILQARRRQRLNLARKRFNDENKQKTLIDYSKNIGVKQRDNFNAVVPNTKKIINQAIQSKSPRTTPRPSPSGRMVANGGVITKNNIGANDFREGGYVLSTVDNRKNKK